MLYLVGEDLLEISIYLMRGEGRSYLENRPIKNSLRFERWYNFLNFIPFYHVCVSNSKKWTNAYFHFFNLREYFSLLLYLASLGITMERIKTINLTSYQSCNKIWKRYRVSFQEINFYEVYASKFYAHNSKNNMGTEIVITKTILKVLRSKHGTNAWSKDNPNVFTELSNFLHVLCISRLLVFRCKKLSLNRTWTQMNDNKKRTCIEN